MTTIMNGSLARAVLLAFIVLFALGCGSAPGRVDTADGEAPGLALPPAPKNAQDLAVAIAGGRVSATLYVDKVRGHPVAGRLKNLGPLGEILDGTGLDLERDLHRVFVTGPNNHDSSRAIVFAEHNLDAPTLRQAIDGFIARSDPPGRWVDDYQVEAAEVTIEGRKSLVAIIEPRFLVVMPPGMGNQAKAFEGTGGLPDPTGDHALYATAMEPSKNLKMPRMPKIPDTIESAVAQIFLRSDGGAEVRAQGVSTSPEQAKKDAKDLEKRIDKATTVKVSIVKVRVFKPIEFRAEGSDVKTEIKLDPSEVNRLLGLAEAFAP